jgi:hypothetical protein
VVEPSASIEVGQATRLGARSEPHYLQQASLVDAGRGVLAVARGIGGHGTGDDAVAAVCEKSTRTTSASTTR